MPWRYSSPLTSSGNIVALMPKCLFWILSLCSAVTTSSSVSHYSVPNSSLSTSPHLSLHNLASLPDLDPSALPKNLCKVNFSTVTVQLENIAVRLKNWHTKKLGLNTAVHQLLTWIYSPVPLLPPTTLTQFSGCNHLHLFSLNHLMSTRPKATQKTPDWHQFIAAVI